MRHVVGKKQRVKKVVRRQLRRRRLLHQRLPLPHCQPQNRVLVAVGVLLPPDEKWQLALQNRRRPQQPLKPLKQRPPPNAPVRKVMPPAAKKPDCRQLQRLLPLHPQQKPHHRRHLNAVQKFALRQLREKRRRARQPYPYRRHQLVPMPRRPLFWP